MATGLLGKIGSALGMQSGAGPLNVRFNVLSAEGIRSLESKPLERIYFAVSVAGTGGSRAKTEDIPFNTALPTLTIPQNRGTMLLHCAAENQILLQCYHDIRLLPDHLLGEAYFPLSSLLSNQQPQWVNLQKTGQMTGRVLLTGAIEGPTPGLMGQGANMPGQTTTTGQTAGMPQSMGGTGAYPASTTTGGTMPVTGSQVPISQVPVQQPGVVGGTNFPRQM
jgi:hypothetical protein